MITWHHGRTRSLLLPLVHEAFANLWAVRRRSALALLGIVIGTASVVALINVGGNAGQEALNQFKAMGTDLVVAEQPAGDGDAGRRGGYDAADAARLPLALPEVGAAAPLILSGTRMSADGRTSFGSILGTTPSLAPVARLTVATGRFLSDYDNGSPFAVVGAGLARKLAPPGRPLAPGDRIRVEDTFLTVIGLLPDMTVNPLIPVDFNETVLLPLDSTRRVLASPVITTIVARVAPDADPAETANRIARYFDARARGHAVAVRTARQLIEGMERQAGLFTRLFAGIGSISLLVGGIGVMNVMLMGVMERRREIGLRMAVGARAADIRVMFLIEALVLSATGGLAGAVTGMAVAWGFARLSGWSFVFSPVAIPLGAGVASVVGVLSGYHPAALAARQDPMEALRAE